MKIVTAAVLTEDGKILIARRKKGSHLEDKWEFPGGKMEQGESPEECLKRELFEEFGITTSVGDFYCESEYDYGQHHIRLLAYRVDHISGEFQLDSHEEIRWVLPSEMLYFDFAEADKPIVQKLLEEAGDAV